MSVAVFVKSESGDGYLYSFGDGESFEDIRDELESNYDYFCPLCEHYVATSHGTKPSLESRVEEFLIEMYKRG